MPLFRPLPLFVYIWAEAGPHISYPVIPGTGIAGASQSLLQRRGLCCVPAILAVSSYSPHASNHPCQSRPGASEPCTIAGISRACTITCTGTGVSLARIDKPKTRTVAGSEGGRWRASAPYSLRPVLSVLRGVERERKRGREGGSVRAVC